MAEPDLLAQIPALIEKGGLPAMVGGGLLALFWKFGRNKGDDPETKMAAALNAIAAKVDAMDGNVHDLKVTLADKFGRYETRLDNLERNK